MSLHILTKLNVAQITREEALKIIEKIDLNKDGVITWDEFLQAMYNWLLESKSLDVNKKDESNPTVFISQPRQRSYI